MQIISSKDFKVLQKSDFRSKEARVIRDKFLKKKKICFLHLAYRYRGKSNYRDAPYIAYSNALFVSSKEFISDLRTVLQEFLRIAFTYTRKRIGNTYFQRLFKDIINNTNFSDQTERDHAI